MSDRLDQLFSELRAYVDERDWSRFHDPKNLAMLISSEAGELLAEYRWVPNTESDSYTADPAARERVTSEVADVAIALFNLCIRLDIDLPTAVLMKLAVIRRNYPADAVRGSAIRPPRPSGRGDSDR
jgi:NTP pyrophosphatase (non-canonical NTP hydrolase)